MVCLSRAWLTMYSSVGSSISGQSHPCTLISLALNRCNILCLSFPDRWQTGTGENGFRPSSHSTQQACAASRARRNIRGSKQRDQARGWTKGWDLPGGREGHRTAPQRGGWIQNTFRDRQLSNNLFHFGIFVGRENMVKKGFTIPIY